MSDGVTGALLVVFGIIGIATLPRMWRDAEWRTGLEPPEGATGPRAVVRRGVVRALPAWTIAGAALGATFVLQEVLDGGVADVAALLFGAVWLGGFAVGARVALSGTPAWAIPPHLRGQPGIRDELRAAQQRG